MCTFTKIYPHLYDYKHANLPLFRSSLDLALDPRPTIQNTIELDHAITTFTPYDRQRLEPSLCTLQDTTTSRSHVACSTYRNSRTTIDVGINENAYTRTTTYTTSLLASSRLTSPHSSGKLHDTSQNLRLPYPPNSPG
jgi:hypothetical protein